MQDVFSIIYIFKTDLDIEEGGRPLKRGERELDRGKGAASVSMYGRHSIDAA